MALTAKASGGTFKNVEPGTYVARCFEIVDLGTHENEMYGNKRHEVRVGWELPTELMDDGKPYSVSKFYGLSLHPDSNLSKDLASWRGKDFSDEERKGFDISKLLGAPCQVSVGLSEKGKPKVNAVTKLMKGIDCAPQINPTRFFSLEVWDQAAFDGLTDFLKEKIMASEEYGYIKKVHSNFDDAGPERCDVPPPDDDYLPF